MAMVHLDIIHAILLGRLDGKVAQTHLLALCVRVSLTQRSSPIRVLAGE